MGHRPSVHLFVAVVVSAFLLNIEALAATIAPENDSGPKPIDYGPGAGVPLDATLAAEPERMPVAAEAAAPGGADARTKGVFGTAVTWPIIPLHAVLLADGRVLSYGTDQLGQQGGQFVYDVWDPSQGTNSASHLVLPNTTGTDIFCSGQSVLVGSGNVLLTGGDTTIGGVRNFSDDATTIFYPRNASNPSDTLVAERPMVFKRWYPSIVPLANGDKLVLGGRQGAGIPASTPEMFSESSGWGLLTGAASNAAYGSIGVNWYYPRAYELPNDPSKVFVLGHNGQMFYLSPAGTGSITQLSQKTLPGNQMLPTVMFASGKLLSLRSNRKVIVADLNNSQPVITTTADVSQVRYWANATVMADGKVLVTGGGAGGNQLTGAAYVAEIWNPVTGKWTLGARALKPRLYHSTALLLPDGGVLTGGGGAPGPVKNLNVEIYFPPYLYDINGNPAPRPTLVTTPALLTLSKNKTFTATLGNANQISRVTLLRAGSTTHANNLEQRFQQLSFTQAGQTLTIVSPSNPNYTITGYYLLFVFNDKGVPSVAKIIKILK